MFGTKYLIDDNQTEYQVNNDLRLNKFVIYGKPGWRKSLRDSDRLIGFCVASVVYSRQNQDRD